MPEDITGQSKDKLGDQLVQPQASVEGSPSPTEDKEQTELKKSYGELRKKLTEQGTEKNQLREDMAAMKAKLEIYEQERSTQSQASQAKSREEFRTEIAERLNNSEDIGSDIFDIFTEMSAEMRDEAKNAPKKELDALKAELEQTRLRLDPRYQKYQEKVSVLTELGLSERQAVDAAEKLFGSEQAQSHPDRSQIPGNLDGHSPDTDAPKESTKYRDALNNNPALAAFIAQNGRDPEKWAADSDKEANE